MLPDRVSNPGPLTYESGALPIALRGPALCGMYISVWYMMIVKRNGCIIKGSNSVNFIFTSLINRDQLMKKKLVC